MKRFFKKLERLFVAITFAEEDDALTARQILKEEEPLKATRPRTEESKKEAAFTAHPIKP